MIDADPELVVFHLLDDPSEAGSKRFETEIGVTLPQLEEALVWMPKVCGSLYIGWTASRPNWRKGYRHDTGPPGSVTGGGFSPASERFDGRMTGQTFS